MLSRVADSIFWMQRYRERAENIARLIDVNLYLSIDAPGDGRTQWEPIIATTGEQSLFAEIYCTPTDKNVIEFLTFNEKNPNSIINCVRSARDNARSVREAITSDMWNELNQLYLFVETSAMKRGRPDSLYEFYQEVKRRCQLFTGITDTTMSHNDCWNFGRLGYLLERADQTSRILDVKYFILLPSPNHVGTAYDDIQWAALLKSVSALEMYRKKWQDIRHNNVIDFLILDTYFPRSVYSCLRRASESLKDVSGGLTERDPDERDRRPPGVPANETQGQDPAFLLDGLCRRLEEMKVYEIVKMGLHEFVDDLQSQIAKLTGSISKRFFAPPPPAFQTQAQEAPDDKPKKPKAAPLQILVQTES